MIHAGPIGHFGRGGVHYDGIGTVYRANRGLRGFGHFQFQNGEGFGTFLSSLVKRAIPFLRDTIFPAVAPAISHVKSSIQDAAANVVEDVIQGENVGESLKRNLTSEGHKLLAKVPRAFSGLMTRASDSEPFSQSKTVKASTSTRKRKKQISHKLASKKGRGSKSKFPGLARF